ncbi:MAG: bifunctional glutamate N-acetyltransferase/amino-acid acetyltransferase ArgJ [Paracoccaceae bacterium]
MGASEDDGTRLARLWRERAALDAEIARLEGRPGRSSGPIVSPLAPSAFPALPAIGGLGLATAATGLRYRGRDDVLVARLAEGTALAGVTTRSATRSAPVLWCEERLAARGGIASRAPAALIVNAGNANAFTGENGRAATRRIAEATARAVGVEAGDVFVASTGVIGEPLDDGAIAAHLADLAARLDAPDEASWQAAARAITTTDTFPKGAGERVALDGRAVSVAGIAKGSGMIAPDMATMLAFVFTDAAVAPDALAAILTSATRASFNAITVDGDTSTSDTLLLAATGAAGGEPLAAGDPRLDPLAAAVERVCLDLALQIVRDGEGATKLVEITVAGAEDDRAAHRVGLAIANSPLVKTAIAGEDPNWGRIVMAVGKAGERADRDRLAVTLGEMTLAREGWRAPDYDEARAAAYMKRSEIAIGVDLGIGAGRARIWTCDLTHRYIAINADYRS